jgi:hypothetical protein
VHRRTAEKVDGLVAELAGGAEGLLADAADVTERVGRIDAVIDCTAADMSLGGLMRLGHAAHPHLALECATLITFISARIFAAPPQTLVGAHDGGRMQWHPRARISPKHKPAIKAGTMKSAAALLSDRSATYADLPHQRSHRVSHRGHVGC